MKKGEVIDFFSTDFEFTVIYVYEKKSLGTTVIILTRISKLKKKTMPQIY